MVVLGGVMAVIFLGAAGTPKDAIALGLATPAVCSDLPRQRRVGKNADLEADGPAHLRWRSGNGTQAGS